MATQLFLVNDATYVPTRYSSGTNDAKADTTASAWEPPRRLSTSRGNGVASWTTATVAGATNGIEVQISGFPPDWYVSPPLAADVTIAGTITFNLRGEESSMSANACMQCIVERIDQNGVIQETVANSERGTELGTSESAQNWTVDATDTAFHKGDRIRLRVLANDAATLTMASGFTWTSYHNGTTQNASGDAWIQFTENLTFIESDPAGTTVYLTDTASAVSTAAVDREAWTSRGGGVQTDVRNTVAGWTAPLQWTDTAGGTVVDWWTRPLAAFTLGGAVLVNLHGATSVNWVSPRVEIAITDGDGANPVTWAGNTTDDGLGQSVEATRVWYIAGPDTAVAEGKRLRIRLLIDDVVAHAMSGSGTATLYYAGSSGATGDTFLTFTQTLTESAGGGVTASPTAASLTLSTGTPTVSAPAVSAPTAASLTLSAGTPTVGISTVSLPTAASLTLTGSAPTVVAVGTALRIPTAASLTLSPATPTVLAPFAATPTAASLTLTGATPTVLAPRVSLPTAAALTLTGSTPTVAAPFAATPTAASLILTAGTPAVVAIGTAVSLPTAASLTLTGATPTVETTGGGAQVSLPTAASLTLSTGTPAIGININSLPTAASLSLTGATATVLAPFAATPMAASLTLSGSVPAVVAIGTAVSLPTAASLTLNAGTPVVVTGGNAVSQPTAADLTLTGATPSVLAPFAASPTAAALTLSTVAPTVVAIGTAVSLPTAAALTLTGAVPTVAAGGNQSAQPTAAALTLSPATPTVSAPFAATPTAASLTLNAGTPTVTKTSNAFSFPIAASLTMTAFAPNVVLSDHKLSVPTAAALTLTTATPYMFITGQHTEWVPRAGVSIYGFPASRAYGYLPDSGTATTTKPTKGTG